MKVSEEYRKLQTTWNKQAQTGEVKDKDNPLFIFQQTDTKLLLQILDGKIDVIQLALLELEGRKAEVRTYYTYNSSGRRIKVTIPT